MENTLRGAVLTKFRSISAFAEAMKWDRKKASRIVNRIQKPTVKDMMKMATVLGVHDSNSFINIFLPEFSTMWN